MDDTETPAQTSHKASNKEIRKNNTKTNTRDRVPFHVTIPCHNAN
jgi:hypothetical protein